MTSTYIGGDSELSELWKCVWDSFLPETVAQKIMQYYPLPWEFNFVLGRRAIDILLHWRSCQLPTILVSVTTRLFFIPSSQSSPLSFFLSFSLSFFPLLPTIRAPLLGFLWHILITKSISSAHHASLLCAFAEPRHSDCAATCELCQICNTHLRIIFCVLLTYFAAESRESVSVVVLSLCLVMQI